MLNIGSKSGGVGVGLPKKLVFVQSQCRWRWHAGYSYYGKRHFRRIALKLMTTKRQHRFIKMFERSCSSEAPPQNCWINFTNMGVGPVISPSEMNKHLLTVMIAPLTTSIAIARKKIPYPFFLLKRHDIMGQGGNLYAKGAR